MSRHHLTVEAESDSALLRTLYALVAAAERRCDSPKPDGAPSRVDWHEEPDPDTQPTPFDDADVETGTVDLRDGNWHAHDGSERKPEQLSPYDKVETRPSQLPVPSSGRNLLFACEIDWPAVDYFRVG